MEKDKLKYLLNQKKNWMKLLNYYNLFKIQLFLLTILITGSAIAQNTTHVSPKKSAILSASCPGLGQVYNKKYWKVPIIYAALGGTLYYYFDYNDKYNMYKDAYIARTDDDETTIDNFSNYTPNNLITLQDYYRDSRDLSGLVFILIYVLNIVDASVDAHLTNYNINDNLSLHLKSEKNQQYFETINLSLTYNL